MQEPPLPTRPEWQTAVARLSALAAALERAQAGVVRARTLLATASTAPPAPPEDLPEGAPAPPDGAADALWKARLQLDLVAGRLTEQTAGLNEVCGLLSTLAGEPGAHRTP